MTTDPSYPLSRKFPWLRRHVARGFARRVLECQRCGAREEQTLNDGVDACARHEGRFRRKHSKCQEKP